MLHDDKLTGWTFECPVDASGVTPDSQGGIVLREMRHDGHNFAKEVRMIGLWIGIEHVDDQGAVTYSDKWFRTLAKNNHFAITAVRKLEPTPILNHPSWPEKFEWLKEVDDALDFADYIADPVMGKYSGYGVMATFSAPNLIASSLQYPDCDFAGLNIEQVFLFSRYSDQPPHEPTGALSAARFHPLVRYELIENPAFDPSKRHTRVASLRFDFRLHVYLDSRFDTKNAPQNQNPVKNQAGIFADRDIFPKMKLFSSATAQSFSAVEKPIVMEVTAPGLIKGYTNSTPLKLLSGERFHDVDCWDNLHWWGLRAKAGTYISAPGAFHCFHMHWRWGKVLDLVNRLTIADIQVLPIDAGIHFNPGIPLLDPRIPYQTLQVAITKNSRRFDSARNALTDLSEMAWNSLFETQTNPPPEKILDGDDIVLWYSTEVLSRLQLPDKPLLVAKSSGTVFLHGIFFAHDDEITGSTVGSTTAEHRPSSAEAVEKAKKWFRGTNW